MVRERRPTAIDLFAGAGLFSLAFKSVGFDMIQAIEMDSIAATTYRTNLGDHIDVKDVRAMRPCTGCDVLIAGPPCQGFSTLGRRNGSDPRNQLCMEVARWAERSEASIVVVENVEAFLESEAWHRLNKRLKRLGYETSTTVLNTIDFGVPQLRRRSFTFASRVGLPSVRRPGGPKIRSVKEAWRGLARVPDGRNHHYSPSPSPLALARMKVIPLGGDKRDVMAHAPHLTPPSWWRVGCAVTDVWGRMQWNAPSNTLRTALQNPSKGRYIHPEQDRVISLREAARLHSIPDTWRFAGLPTQIARQIGNSVPPRLGRAVALACKRQLS